MNRHLLLPLAFVPVVFYVYACGGDDEAAPPEQDGGTSSSGGSSSGSTTSSGGSSSGGMNDAGEDAPTTCGNPLAEDGGTGDGGVSISADGGAIAQIVSAPSNFLDGPQFTDLIDGGALVYSEVFMARTVTVAPGGGTPTELIQMPGTPNQQLPIGNALKGTAILTTVTNDFGATTGQTPGILQTFIDGGSGAKISIGNAAHDPNDLVVTKDGIIFFSDPAYQAGVNDTGVYRITTDNNVTAVKNDYNGDRPDGIALSPDDKMLYVAVSNAKRIERFDIGAAGTTTVANPATLQAQYIDDLEGLAVDTSGNIWVAESAHANDLANPPNGGRVEVFTPTGTKLGELAFPDHRPTAVAFGGTDNKTVYIVTNKNDGGGTSYTGNIWKFTSRCAGLR